MRRLSRPALVAAAAALAAIVNVLIHLISRAAGGTFTFTAAGGRAEVDALTVAGFSVVPLAAGLTAVALLAPRLSWVSRAAQIAGPLLAAGTIVTMTLPADFDTVSTVSLALCHLTLVPIIIVAVAALDRRAAEPVPQTT
ncbi:DUF6069 family protein [Actinoplanes sp. NPDC023801]|uniref:DUF6069 family protein n=1 Tax=Actinoplanes sp. NPDC023801 TaxID=3154595 RepID=UPI0033E6B36B